MHAAGFQHEHARSDRDAYVTIAWEEIAPDMRFAFEKDTSGARDHGPYDYESILHYPAHAFSARGNPTIIPHQEGASIGLHRGLSSLDIAGVHALYAPGGQPVPRPPASPPSAPPVAPPATPPTFWGVPVPVPLPPVPLPPVPLPLPPVSSPAGWPAAWPAGWPPGAPQLPAGWLPGGWPAAPTWPGG